MAEIIAYGQFLIVKENMGMKKKTKNTTFKTSLLNDCTNHIAFQLEQSDLTKKQLQGNVNLRYETPLDDDVTSEYIRGYN